jgi:short-subunit dehydrogenase
MENLRDQTAVITGASGAIGGAIALELARAGAHLCLTGRDENRLQEAVTACRQGGSPRVEGLPADLTRDEEVAGLAERAVQALGGVDLLIHSQGLFRAGAVESSPIADLDAQYQVNLRSPYLLTQHLLPSLLQRQGQIVFVNSTAGLQTRGEVAAYGATKHGLRALADGLREEVNRRGVRVMTLYPGRTASAMQAEVCDWEGSTYDPERFAQPRDIALMTVQALALPRSAEVTELTVRQMKG